MYAKDMGEGSKFTFLRDSHIKAITNPEIMNDLKRLKKFSGLRIWMGGD